MLLTLTRFQATDRSTIGRLDVDGVHECFTLEDPVREPGVKIPGATAIPPGTYEVVIGWSPRFQREMPRLLNVPGFSGILIHWGNSDVDTDGCILVGQRYSKDWVYSSRAAFAELYDKLQHAFYAGERITLDLVEEAE